MAYRYINHLQSHEERQEKYNFVRAFGRNSAHARRMRDWRWNKIYRCFDLPIPHINRAVIRGEKLLALGQKTIDEVNIYLAGQAKPISHSPEYGISRDETA